MLACSLLAPFVLEYPKAPSCLPVYLDLVLFVFGIIRCFVHFPPLLCRYTYEKFVMKDHIKPPQNN